ncbi:MAG: enoyl-CoA hydratase-related protein, partial [Chloroflexota bacterium]
PRLRLIGAAGEELREIWRRIEADPNVWVVVLTGAGERAFCVGADMSAQATGETGLAYWKRERPGGFGGLAIRRTLTVPVIAAVNGHAIGGGLEMVLGCDIVVAVEDARFGLSEPRVGRIPLDGGVFQLVRQLPRRLAMSMLLTGRQISAADAHRYGLINEVVPRADLGAAVQRWVDEVLACAPLSVRAIKEMVLGAEMLGIEDAIRTPFPTLMEALDSDDASEGVRAFREKRRPIWRAT